MDIWLLTFQSNVLNLLRDTLQKNGYGDLPIDIRSMNKPYGYVAIGIGKKGCLVHLIIDLH